MILYFHILVLGIIYWFKQDAALRNRFRFEWQRVAQQVTTNDTTSDKTSEK